MSRMVSDLLDRVRQVLQDQDQNGFRYPTSDLVGYLNDAVTEAARIRPDIFIGGYTKNLPQVTTLGGTDYSTVKIPLPDTYFTSLVGYVAGFAEMRDDEFAVDGRASTFLNSFTQKLMGAA
jgi:hypothetical protein